ncbi:DUF2182 domain-containing protein [Neorhizobium sp. NPDC001467]|uniref:copper chaperone n=1 Tax=Neorhizobium sp. NPDC001467 TaxID=3390595 RepID=UPI003D0792EE
MRVLIVLRLFRQSPGPWLLLASLAGWLVLSVHALGPAGLHGNPSTVGGIAGPAVQEATRPDAAVPGGLSPDVHRPGVWQPDGQRPERQPPGLQLPGLELPGIQRVGVHDGGAAMPHTDRAAAGGRGIALQDGNTAAPGIAWSANLDKVIGDIAPVLPGAGENGSAVDHFRAAAHARPGPQHNGHEHHGVDTQELRSAARGVEDPSAVGRWWNDLWSGGRRSIEPAAGDRIVGDSGPNAVGSNGLPSKRHVSSAPEPGNAAASKSGVASPRASNSEASAVAPGDPGAVDRGSSTNGPNNSELGQGAHSTPHLGTLSQYDGAPRERPSTRAVADQLEGTAHAVHLIHGDGEAVHAHIGPWPALGLWIAMLAAMAPLVLLSEIGFLWRYNLPRRRWPAIAIFFLFYGMPWLALGLAWVTVSAANLSFATPPGSVIILPSLLLVALWHAAPWRQRCLNRCHRMPALRVVGRGMWRDVALFGWRAGMLCCAVCGPAMLFAMSLPMFHFATMLLATALAAFERYLPTRKPAWQFPAFLARSEPRWRSLAITAPYGA